MRADYEPTAEMEVQHLAEQCATLLRENERLRAEILEWQARWEDAVKAFDVERKLRLPE